MMQITGRPTNEQSDDLIGNLARLALQKLRTDLNSKSLDGTLSDDEVQTLSTEQFATLTEGTLNDHISYINAQIYTDIPNELLTTIERAAKTIFNVVQELKNITEANKESVYANLCEHIKVAMIGNQPAKLYIPDRIITSSKAA